MQGVGGTAAITTAGENDEKAVAQSVTFTASREERRRVGRPHSKDKPLEDVVASEMSRIRQAFDVRLVEHTEDLIGKVGRGEAIGEQTSNNWFAKKK